MEFESLDGSIKAIDFSNVRIKNNRGRNYPAGKRGQFIPPKQGKFRTFWMQTVGNPPSRWCRVHKSMLSKLKNKKFVGDMTREMDGKNNPYLKLKNLRLVG